MNEVVYLKNGGILRGVIIEQVPNTSLKVQMRDKSIVACRYDEVEKITKENGYSRDGSNVVRKPALAWMWSFFFPGAGQIYNGQYMKGSLMLSAGFSFLSGIPGGGGFVRIFVELANGYGYETLWGYFILLICLWIWSQIDAPIMANKLNNR